MTSQEKYRQFCLENYVPLGHQPWWLDAVCGGPERWHVALAFDEKGAIRAILPYFLRKKWGFLTLAETPPLTCYAGVWFHFPQKSKNWTPGERFSFEKKMVGQLVRQLPKVALFRQRFRPEFQNWLPFFWLGFRQTTRYTYRFLEIGNWKLEIEKLEIGNWKLEEDDVFFKKLHDYDLLRKFRKAATVVQIVETEELGELKRLFEHSLKRRGLPAETALAALERLDTELARRGQRAILLARERHSGAVHAAIYLAWDGRWAVNLAGGFGPDFRTSQATYLLILEALKLASTKAQYFDFEGSMDAGLERVYRSFGAEQTVYFEISRAGNRVLEWLFSLRGGRISAG